MKNFKFHWGHGMGLVLIVFMAFIVTMFSLILNSGGVDLVKEDYYIPDEIVNKQNQAQKRFNLLPDSIRPSFETADNGILIKFPKNWEQKHTKGKINILKSLLLFRD